MAVTVEVPGPLQKLTNGQAVVEISDVDTIEELIDGLDGMYPGIKGKLIKDGKIRGYVNMFVNDDDIRLHEGAGTRIKDSDCVTIVPSIAGGR